VRILTNARGGHETNVEKRFVPIVVVAVCAVLELVAIAQMFSSGLVGGKEPAAAQSLAPDSYRESGESREADQAVMQFMDALRSGNCNAAGTLLFGYGDQESASSPKPIQLRTSLIAPLYAWKRCHVTVTFPVDSSGSQFVVASVVTDRHDRLIRISFDLLRQDDRFEVLTFGATSATDFSDRAGS